MARLNDKQMTVQQLKDMVAAFRDERNWRKHHSPKNLAMSIAIEAAELMELFQWDEYTKNNQQKIKDELADILAYCFNFADTLDIDIASSFVDKLDRAKLKYPVELFNENRDKPNDYARIKQAYRRGKK
ncbi:MAG TPA: nucleotide pyrophosphohydrolase [Candidatus Saccharimonadales bacterium]|nr:nucleotide pyrophosphohydrolase [Candidatus Saccharimonadales bacterium]